MGRMLATVLLGVLVFAAPASAQIPSQASATPFVEELPAQSGGIRMVLVRFPTPIVTSGDADSVCRTLNYNGGAKFYGGDTNRGLFWVICATRVQN